LRSAAFSALVAGQAFPLAVVGVGLSQLVAQARLPDPQIIVAISRIGFSRRWVNSTALTELRRVWCRHPNSSHGDQCRLSSGVRETGGSSAGG
jgi:hypothetical protein